MAHILRLFFHIFPAIIFVGGFTYLAIGGVLLVAICYVKVFKLQATLEDTSVAEERQSLAKTIKWWRQFTFLAKQ